MKHFIVSLCLSWCSLALSLPEIGKVVPDFTLPGYPGEMHSLSKQRGKYVVLEWFNNDCPYVEKHYDGKMSNMQTLQRTWIEKAQKQGKQLVWYSIVSSAPGEQGFVTKTQAKKIRDIERKAFMTSILFDKEGKVGKKYGAKTTPHMFVIDPKGHLAYQGAIDDKPSANLASLKGAKNYVAASLSSLFAGDSPPNHTTKPYGCSVKY